MKILKEDYSPDETKQRVIDTKNIISALEDSLYILVSALEDVDEVELAKYTRQCISKVEALDTDFYDNFEEFLEEESLDAFEEEDFVEDEVQLESLRESDFDSVRRYSDNLDDDAKQKGWWYFTTHGIGPGSIPTDLHVLETRDGVNEKGTQGVYVRLDGILNTSELNKLEMKELAPIREDTVKTSDGKWTNKGEEGTHGKFKTKKEADQQRKAMFAQGYKGR